MTDERLNIILGLVLLPAICLAVVAVLIIGDRPLRPVIRIQAEFSRVGQLQVGAKVKIANMEVGRVTGITFLERQIRGKTVRRVRVHAWVYRKHRRTIFRNSPAFVNSAALIGERHLEIGFPRGGPDRPIRSGDVLMGQDPSHMDRLLALGYNSLVATTNLTDALKPEIKRIKKTLKTTEASIDVYKAREAQVNRIADRLKLAANDLKSSWKTLQTATNDFDDFERLEKRFTDTGERIKKGVRPLVSIAEDLYHLVCTFRDTIGKRFSTVSKVVEARFEQVEKRFNRMEAWLKVVQRMVEQGDGTIGAFMRDKELWDDFKVTGRIIRQQIWNTIARPKKMSVKGSPGVP